MVIYYRPKHPQLLSVVSRTCLRLLGLPPLKYIPCAFLPLGVVDEKAELCEPTRVKLHINQEIAMHHGLHWEVSNPAIGVILCKRLVILIVRTPVPVFIARVIVSLRRHCFRCLSLWTLV